MKPLSGFEYTPTNRLYFGDCLDVMAEYIPDNTIDLIYLDPPFNSKRIYNAFIGGAQWVAFDDTWKWYEAVDDFERVARLPDMDGIFKGGFRMSLYGTTQGAALHGNVGLENMMSYSSTVRAAHGLSMWMQ